jgi:hypothetical protein
LDLAKGGGLCLGANSELSHIVLDVLSIILSYNL